MSEYKLEIKQLVDYPRCRIYRQFIQLLMQEQDIYTGNRAGLFHYIVLSCYANFRTSYKRIEGISYTIQPGQWLCRIGELTKWFRVRFHNQAIAILQELQDRHLITYTLLGRNKLVKFSITNWRQHNRILDYNAPCQKESGFFFLPIATANELVSCGRCSEMDALLDLWINTVYNDEQVQGSDIGPVVYIRNGTGNPLVSYSELGKRWGVSKATAGRYLQELQEMDFIELLSFSGTHGTAIYLRRFLSTMFEISDVLIDKDEVAMALNIRVNLPESSPDVIDLPPEVTVSKQLSSVSNSHIVSILQKVKKVLAAQGFSCVVCPRIQYKLLPLSTECKEAVTVSGSGADPGHLRFLLTMSCIDSREIFRFEINLLKGAEL